MNAPLPLPVPRTAAAPLVRTLTRRIGAVALYLVVLLAPVGVLDATIDLLWDTAVSLAFAFGAMRLLRAGRPFVMAIVTLVTIAMPLAVLMALAMAQHGAAEAASVLVASLRADPLRAAFEFLLPAVTTAIALPTISRRAAARLPPAAP
jgi:hypothetical protein